MNNISRIDLSTIELIADNVVIFMKHKCHREVDAEQIVDIVDIEGKLVYMLKNDAHNLESAILIYQEEDFSRFHKKDYTPVIGDYLVTHADGGRSVCQQKFFQYWYTKIE
jgi:AICAR transformylase/IMP cyclohydrolase PurH